MRGVVTIDYMRGAVLQHPAGAGTFRDHLEEAVRRQPLLHAEGNGLGHGRDMDTRQKLVHHLHHRAGAGFVTHVEDGFSGGVEDRRRGVEAGPASRCHDAELPRRRLHRAAGYGRVEIADLVGLALRRLFTGELGRHGGA